MTEELSRPSPPRSVTEVAAAWFAWFGLRRLVAGALAVAVVIGGAIWLVRVPPPATEAGLPRASTTTAVTGSSGIAGGSTAATGGAPPASSTTAASPWVVVHVAGAVAAPGVHRLPAPARVVDAVDAAGGTATGADLDAVNLAAPVADGQRVYVPWTGEVVAGAVVDLVPAGTSPPSAPAGPVDLNAAGVAELDALPGVGPSTAAAIVDHRERIGPFASVDDLLDVRGIGPAKLEALRGLVTT